MTRARRNTLVIFGLYAVLAFALNAANRYQINRDGIRYLELARHVSEGRIFESVDMRRAPLIIWLLAPLVRLPFFREEPLFAARLVMGFSGILALAAAKVFIRRFRLSGGLEFAALSCLAALLAHRSSLLITPDAFLAAGLLLYFYYVTDDGLIEKPRTAFAAGLAAGAAYLSKHFAFPFFLVHFPLAVFLRSRDRSGAASLRALALGLAGFFLLASPGLALLRWKLGYWTFGGFEKRDMVAPPYWVSPLDEHWSPLDNPAAFLWQAAVCLRGLLFFSVSAFGFGGIVLVASFFALALLFFRKEAGIFYKTLFAAAAVYVAGYCGIYCYEERYFWPVMILLYFLACQGLEKLGGKFSWKVRFALAGLLFFPLVVRPIENLAMTWPAIFQPRKNPYREMAGMLSGMSGHAAAVTCWRWHAHNAVYIGFYRGKPFETIPYCPSPDHLVSELEARNAPDFVVFSGSHDQPGTRLSEKLKNDPRFFVRATLPPVDGWTGKVEVFELHKGGG